MPEQLLRERIVPALVDAATAPSELPHRLAFARSIAAQSGSMGKGALQWMLLEAGAMVCTIDGVAVMLGDPQQPLHVG